MHFGIDFIVFLVTFGSLLGRILVYLPDFWRSSSDTFSDTVLYRFLDGFWDGFLMILGGVFDNFSILLWNTETFDF